MKIIFRVLLIWFRTLLIGIRILICLLANFFVLNWSLNDFSCLRILPFYKFCWFYWWTIINSITWWLVILSAIDIIGIFCEIIAWVQRCFFVCERSWSLFWSATFYNWINKVFSSHSFFFAIDCVYCHCFSSFFTFIDCVFGHCNNIMLLINLCLYYISANSIWLFIDFFSIHWSLLRLLSLILLFSGLFLYLFHGHIVSTY